MLVTIDPLVLILTAIALWAFWLACVIRDRRTAGREGPRRDAMPSLAPGSPPAPFCGLCGGPHDYDDCPLERDAA